MHKKRKCRVALENASKQVEVHEDFRCIMIEEERDLQHSDPPRLNRCEKQCLTYLDVLHDLGKKLRINSDQLLAEMQAYCHEIATQQGSASPGVGESASSSQPMDVEDADDQSAPGSQLTTRDAFLGYTEDALPSLLVREMQTAQTHIGGEGAEGANYVAEVRARCKATLHDLMPADAVARSETSLFAQTPENEQQLSELIESYYQSTHHAGLRECLQHVWPRLVRFQADETMPDVSGSEAANTAIAEADTGVVQQQCLLVLTFTSYACNVGQLLRDRGVEASNIKMLRIGAFESEKTLRAEVDGFWQEDETHDLLMIQCDATHHSQHLLLMREIMREAEEAYKDVTVAARRPKAQAIVLHLHRFAGSAACAGRWEFSHLSEWKQIVVDRLEGEAKDFELLKAARKTRDATGLVTGAFDGGWQPPRPLPLASLSDLIRSELPWALRRLGYPHRDVRMVFEYLNAVSYELLGNAEALSRLEGRVRRLLDAPNAQKPVGGWLPSLAADLGALVKASSLTTLVREVMISSVRQWLALLLHQLETHSALAGLRSCRSPEERAIWLDLFLPEDDSRSVLGKLVPPQQLDGWGTECLGLVAHHMQLKWAFSSELERRLRSRKARFVEMCKPAWSPEAIASVRNGLCLDFVSEHDEDTPNLLRRLAEVRAERSAQDPGGQPMDVESEPGERGARSHVELAQKLEELWLEHKTQFRDDVQHILSSELALRDQGISADRTATLIGAALRPAHAHDGWHPADLCVQHWRIEPLLRHAMQLYLFISDQRFELSGEDDFVVELVERATRSCLGKAMDDVSSWLATAQRCLNYARKLEQDADGLDLSEGTSLWRLQLCVDFCSRVALKCKGASALSAREALNTLASQNDLAHDQIIEQWFNIYFYIHV